MAMRTRISLGVLVALFIAALATGGVFSYQQVQAPSILSQQQVLPATKTPFQPEAQMIQNAINPTGSLKRPERAAAEASRNTTLPYTYDATLCGTVIDSGPHFKCLQSYYQKLVDSFSIDIAFSDLKKRYNTDTFVVAQCHPLTHVIGRQAVKLYPTVSKAYQHGDSFCWSGYYHGVLEGIVKNIGQENLPKKMDTICADIPGKATYNFDYYNCVHGLGHGIMELDGDDVFSSLTQCDNLTGDWEKQSCYSGTFMENVIVFGRDGSSPGLKAEDPIYPCTAVDSKYKFQCYLGQTSFVLSQNGGNFKATFGVCAGVEPAFREVCGQSIGRDAANYANHDAAQTKTTCDLATFPQDKTNCVIGAVKEFISYHHAITQANAYCNILPDPDKSTCLSTGAIYFKNF